MLRARCATPYRTLCESATIASGATETLEFRPDGTRHLAIYRVLGGSPTLGDLYIDALRLNSRIDLLGGSFDSGLSGSPDGRIHLRALHRYCEEAMLARPLVIAPRNTLSLTLRNDNASAVHVTVALYASPATPREIAFAERHAPLFIHGQAVIPLTSTNRRVLLPAVPEPSLFRRMVVACEDEDEVRVNVIVGTTTVREEVYVPQLNAEFAQFEAPEPYRLLTREGVLLEVTNPTAAARRFSFLAEAEPARLSEVEPSISL